MEGNNADGMRPVRWGLLIGAAWLGACASRKPMTTTAPAAAGKPVQAVQMGSGPRYNYVVKAGDSLWAIAGRKSVLGDPFRWPLLYRQNRDQIQDPDLIEVRQDLGFRRRYSREEIREAVRLAGATPPYEKHARPRKVLPVQY